MLPDMPRVVRLPGGSVRIVRSALEDWVKEQASGNGSVRHR
jgi:predicted DNA-binding transcriptional regulator AlpA